MPALARNETSKLASAALVAGLLFAAAPAAADILVLDCSVSVDTYNIVEGRAGDDSGSSRGAWKIRAVYFPDSHLAPEVRLTETAPFGMPYRRSGLDFDYLEGYDDDPTLDEDQIEWCPDRRGCGARIPFLTGHGWYRVSRAVVDRRRATFSLTVEHHRSDLGIQMEHRYFGTCAPEPGQQF